jgi:hypothetical protein
MNRSDADRIYWEFTAKGYEVEFQFDGMGKVRAVVIRDKEPLEISFDISRE